MKKRMKAVALTGLLSAFCLIPLNSAQAHNAEKWKKHRHVQYHNVPHHKNHHKQRKTIVVKKVIVHKHTPKRVVYVHKEQNDSDLIAAALVSTALLLALD